MYRNRMLEGHIEGLEEQCFEYERRIEDLEKDIKNLLKENEEMEIIKMNNDFMSAEIDKLASSLSKTQLDLKNVTKDRFAYNYKYAELPSYFDAIRESFSQNGLSISQLIINDILVTLLMHESGQWLRSTFNIQSVVSKSTNDMQAFGSGISYARRYALACICGIAQEDEDDDAQKMTPSVSNASSNHILVKGKFDDKKPDQPRVRVSNLKLDDESINFMKNLKNLCEENDVDFVKFGNFHKLDSNNVTTIKNAIEDFKSYLNRYNKQL